MSKTVKTRVQNKHDTEANWNLAVNFIPLHGELIIYDADDFYNYERFKIGDGTRSVVDLPFFKAASAVYTEEIDETKWELDPIGGGYRYSISYTTHGKGKNGRYFFPNIKTYSAGTSGLGWEETYDSPEIDITTGNVIFRADKNTPSYLVVIS